MGDFENSFTADDKFVKEYSNAWMWHRQMPLFIRIELAAVFILGVLMMRFSLSSTDSMLALLCIVVSVMVPVVVVINTRTAVRISRDRNNLLKASGTCHTAIHNDSCVVYGKEGKELQTFPLSAVIDRYESRNYFYLVFSGMLVLPFSKIGFTAGNADQFRARMKGMPKKKNTRVITVAIVLVIVIAAVLFTLIKEIQTYRAVGWLLPMVNSMRQ